jgi:predicted nuclease of predicted toxin-antitoxin system
MKYYLDEDISPKVAELLRERDIDAVSAHEKGMRGVSDKEQLKEAARQGRVLVTRNRDDFILLSVRFFEDLKPHHGIIIIVPHSIPGTDFNVLARLLSEYSKEHPKGLEPYTIEFISRVE